MAAMQQGRYALIPLASLLSPLLWYQVVQHDMEPIHEANALYLWIFFTWLGAVPSTAGTRILVRRVGVHAVWAFGLSLAATFFVIQFSTWLVYPVCLIGFGGCPDPSHDQIRDGAWWTAIALAIVSLPVWLHVQFTAPSWNERRKGEQGYE